MIIKHKIIVENNEEVLLVYLDDNLEEFGSEFGDDSVEREKNLTEQVKDYIKNKNINFGGKVVKVLAGALLVATLAVAPSLGNIKTQAATSDNTQSYVVEPGDSLWNIARSYDMTVDEIKEINNLRTDTIQPGQVIMLRSNAEVGTYVVKSGDSLWTIARAYGMTVNELKDLNNVGDIIQPGQRLKVVQAEAPQTYTVKSGDNLWNLAREFNTSIDSIKLANNLRTDVLQPGQVLTIPTGTKTSQTPTTRTYTVKSGDNLWNLAREFNTTVNNLRSANNLRTDVLQPGQVLTIPSGTTQTTTSRYTVQSGDNLWTLARTFNTSTDSIKNANGLTSDIIQPGQILTIPNSPVSPTPGGQTTPAPTNIAVKVRRSSGVVQSISLEEYVTGVVAAELGAGFNEASYKAQALAARTYAAERMQQGKIITDTDSHQVYLDRSQIRSSWGEHDFNKYYPLVEKAVNATKSEIITYNGEYIEALFHSTSNGRTEEPQFVWGGELDYLKSVDSHWDTKSPYFYRSTTLTNSEFAARLGISTSNLYATVTSRTANGSVNSINIGGRAFSGNYVKSRLGLRSTDFTLKFGSGKVTIEQRGWGHSVGLSQYGAYFMGEEGYTYEQIIHHYYHGVKIVTI